MRIADLRIGDWVKVGETDRRPGYVGKIKEINGDTGYLLVGIKKGDASFEIVDVFYAEIKPIPLTVEIVCKNYRLLRGHNITIDHGLDGDTDSISSFKIRVNGIEIWFSHRSFVHQFQSALALCGLPEIAECIVV